MSPSWILGSAFSMLLSTVMALDFPAYPGLRLNQSRAGVLEVAFNSPPVNVWGLDTITGLGDIVQKLRNDTDTKVVLFTSDVPGFFVNHLDLLITPFGKLATKELYAILSCLINIRSNRWSAYSSITIRYEHP